METVGIKYKRPTHQNKNYVPEGLVYQIIRKQHSHIITALGNPIAGFCFFLVWFFEYYNTPKSKKIWTRILKKEEIKFYRKTSKLKHSGGRIHLEDKLSLTFRTKKMVSKKPQ